MSSAFVFDGVRTPFGKFGGGLAAVRPDDLAAHVVKSLVERAPGLDPAAIDDSVFGLANGAGEDNRDVARMAVLLAGLPVSVPGTTVNRLCGSSLDATMIASRHVETGDADLVLVGGVESMSRAPWVLPKPERAYPAGNAELASTTLGWRLVNTTMPKEWTASLGECNEQLAEEFGIGRDRQDEFAVRSQTLALQAWEDGFYDSHVVPVPVANPKRQQVLERDESIRPGTTLESVSGLKPSFRDDGTITAANASPLSDGAAALFVGSEKASDLLGQAPLARIVGRAAFALEPQRFGFAPKEAADRALARAGLSWSDVGLVELNEAFAVQSLACVDAWGIDPQIVNRRGGAIALGHPLGASGARLMMTLTRGMQADDVRYGVAAICIGVGQALAVVVELVK
ncbi:MAG: thiolase family protein [Dermatophilus congolensis]|nr:thiolase family protein [Dermatophilus congolensis]